MSGDASLALAATSLAADVAPLLLNKYLGSDSPVTTALTEAAKNLQRRHGAFKLAGRCPYRHRNAALCAAAEGYRAHAVRNPGERISEYTVPGGNGGSSPQFVFAPNITITGDADRQQIASIMEDEYEKFKAFMDKYNRENNRTRYA